ncbi:MAG TPA: hypothetical protein VN721_06300 [Flavipsychrobacter sp.]|nr:hypothetical protein [Flavipsychrobacter sp.]
MRKPLVEIEEIERYLEGNMPVKDKLVFQARAIISDDLQGKISLQQRVYKIIRHFARDNQRVRLESIYSNLIKDDHFKSQIETIFR